MSEAEQLCECECHKGNDHCDDCWNDYADLCAKAEAFDQGVYL